MLDAGDRVPIESVENEAGETVDLVALARGRAVLYFYPKADTPGCTNESRQFRDLYTKFKRKNTEVVGVSRGVAAQRKSPEVLSSLP